MVESWRKVIPGSSMIKLTPHRVSQIRFCALDTVAAGLFNAVSRSVSPVTLTSLHCNYSECVGKNASGQRGRMSITVISGFSLTVRSTDITQELVVCFSVREITYHKIVQLYT